MVFSSSVFLFLFLPVVLGLYFALPQALRNLVLLCASLFFYVWGEQLYICVLLGSIATNYVMGLLLDRFGTSRRAAHVLMALAVAANLGLLMTFKYANFLVDNLNALLGQVGTAPIQVAPVHLPLGISFFTFHALSYVIDVYRGEVAALKNPLNFALYIAFFPQSIAGPIVRYSDIAGQLTQRVITREGFADGIQRFILGLSKKMLIANTLASPADAIFGLPAASLTPGLAWLGIACYTLQIFFDFSGYSDMAIGLANLFGFRFRENFAHPYIATSVTDFWRRWHISLSTWYRDYLYIPLGGNRRGTSRLCFNLVTVFCLCGLWHGASWTFLLWGLFHGAFLVLERTRVGRWLEAAWTPVRHTYALFVVLVGWVFFRATTLPQALAFLGALGGFATGTGVKYYPALYLNTEVALALAAGLICSLPLLDGCSRLRDRLLVPFGGMPRLGYAMETAFVLLPLMGLALLLWTSAMLLAAGTYSPFLYFRF